MSLCVVVVVVGGGEGYLTPVHNNDSKPHHVPTPYRCLLLDGPSSLYNGSRHLSYMKQPFSICLFMLISTLGASHLSLSLPRETQIY